MGLFFMTPICPVCLMDDLRHHVMLAVMRPAYGIAGAIVVSSGRAPVEDWVLFVVRWGKELDG